MKNATRAVTRVLLLPALAAAVAAVAGCGGSGGERMAGAVRVDGSSTVFPITEAAAEEFRGVAPNVQVTVGVSGTGGGFKKFCLGETDINDASRPIQENERAQAAEKGIAFVELPVAFDGLTVVVNPENAFVDALTVEELRAIWNPESTVKMWSDVRPAWPAEPIKLYGPGHDSGTFDYFTEVVNGKAKACRADFTASEDDNVLVQGVSGDVHSLGFFGFAYFAENRDKLRAVPIDGGAGPVLPSLETVANGTYSPLSRPIFLYVARAAADRPEVDAFVDFYLGNVPTLSKDVGYVPLPEELYGVVRARWDARTTGTVFHGMHEGVPLPELLARPAQP